MAGIDTAPFFHHGHFGRDQLKFPDTFQIHGIWAYDFYNEEKRESVMAIRVYYSALIPLGLRRRGEFQAFYNLGAMTFTFSGTSDSLSSQIMNRPVDVSQVPG